MPIEFSADLLRELAADRGAAVLVCDTVYEPAAGRGAPIAPATYAKAGPRDSSDQAAGPAFTDAAVLRRASSPEGTGFHEVDVVNGRPRIGASVVISSVGAEATRVENALWDCRDELDLPGIILTTEEDGLVGEVFEAEVKKHAGKIKNTQAREATVERATSFRPAFEALLAAGGVSSWTAPHRHADAWIRTAIDRSTGKPVWAGGELYERIINAGPTDMRTLLRLSPNAIGFGFWLSIGAPVGYKLARSISAEIIGYGAHRVWRTATKGSPYPTSNKTAMHSDIPTGEITVHDGEKAPKGYDSPSTFGFGTIPTTWSNKTVTCEDILGTTTISFTGLRAALARDAHMDTEDRTAAIAALTALGLYGRALVDQDAFLRSGCDLIDTSTTWGLRRRGTSEIERVVVPQDAAALLPAVKATLEVARARGVFGGRDERVFLSPSSESVRIIADAFLRQSFESSADAAAE